MFLQCFECDLPAFAYATGCSQLAIQLFFKDFECKNRWQEYHLLLMTLNVSHVISFNISMKYHTLYRGTVSMSIYPEQFNQLLTSVISSFCGICLMCYLACLMLSFAF